jgi:transcription initiation factor TFIID TATA-box-binding protein
MITVQNIVSTFNVGCCVDLKRLVQHCKDATHNPRKFSAVTMKMKVPKATALIFASGKIVCIGTKSVVDNSEAILTVSNILKLIGYPVKATDVKIRNVVGSANINCEIDLINLNNSHRKLCLYEQELFPGLKFKLPSNNACALIFTTGKIVVTGVKSEYALKQFFRKVLCIVDLFRK